MLSLVPAGPATAQITTDVPQNAILTIEAERLFAESAFGRQVARDIEVEGAALAAQNRQIEAQLTAEEKELTARRAELDAATFRSLANAFDVKVQDIRRKQDAKARALTGRLEASRVAFLRAAQPVLEQLMLDAGASVILERASVFFSANASDVTDEAIERIDALIGAGVDGGTSKAPDATQNDGGIPETRP